jgi:23S rRNA (cytosine1962-C5)-methyltransferase
MPLDARHRLPPVAVDGRGAARLDAGHPWVYRSDVLTPPPRPGFAPVVDRRGRPLGWAAVHPTSQIAVRLLHRGDAPIDEALLLARLDAALDLRAALAADPDAGMGGVTGYRCVHAEADGLPGLIVDRLGPVLVVQNGCAALEPHLAALVARLSSASRRRGCWAASTRAPARSRGCRPRCGVLHGERPRAGRRLRRRAHLARRPARRPEDRRVPRPAPQPPAAGGAYAGAGARAPTEDARGIDALDAFSHHGGFGLHLLRAGARSARAGRHLGGRARGGRRDRGAARPAARPSSTAPTRSSACASSSARASASARSASTRPRWRSARATWSGPWRLQGAEPAGDAAARPGGVLGTSSCSAHLQEAEFLNVLADAAADAGRSCTCSGASGPRPTTPSASASPRAAT